MKGIGTGFFCEINYEKIPFRKALFINNLVLDENRIKLNEQVEFEYCGEKRIIEITKDRNVFTNKKLDCACVEILEIDKITVFILILHYFHNSFLKYKFE